MFVKKIDGIFLREKSLAPYEGEPIVPTEIKSDVKDT